MLASATAQLNKVADALLESDRRYFGLGAESQSLGFGELCWVPGQSRNPAGCVYHIDFPGQKRLQGAAEGCPLASIEAAFVSLHSPIARIYTPTDCVLAPMLGQAGYECRSELGYLIEGSQVEGMQEPLTHLLHLRPVLSNQDWADKCTLQRSSKAVPDGHQHAPEDWIELERQRSRSGSIEWFLAETDGEICGTFGLARSVGLTRIKNVLVHPKWRRKGIAQRMLKTVFANELPESSTQAVGVFGVAGSLGERLYRSCGMSPVCEQLEWVRPLSR